MKAKFLSVTLIAILLSVVIHAQTKPTFGVRAGINFQNLNGKNSSGEKLDNKLKTGFNAGVNAEIPVGIDFFLQPGLLFSLKGSKDKTVDASISLSYVEIPVNFLYKPELGDGRVLLGFGPYAAVAIAGTNKIGNIKTDVEFGSNPATFKRFDTGANMLAGYEWANNFSVQLNAGLGLVNLKNRINGDNNSVLKNTGFGISAGYRF